MTKLPPQFFASRICLALPAMTIWCVASVAQPATPPTAPAAAQQTDKADPTSGVKGEPWHLIATYEYYGAKDREASKRDRKESVICVPSGSMDVSSAANSELPAEFKGKCWVADKRAEPKRQQIKYACKNGTTAEAATRQEAEYSFGSQIVINVPEKGAISITRSLRRLSGVCDAEKAVLTAPAAPKPPLAK